MDDASHRPRLAARTAGLRPSLYARILARVQQYEGEIYPFHIGETHLLPPAAVQEALRQVDDRALHRYGHPQGIPALREAIAAQLAGRGYEGLGADDVVVTHGATHGLSMACQAILDPGDEVLVLSPHWPLINGMVHAACAEPVEVPFSCQLRDTPGVEAASLLLPHLTPKTRAVYVTSPNNPDGTVLREDELASIARFCVAHDLYALVDEAYERFSFGERAPPLRSFPGMAERCISVFTLSKSHRMAGLRVGYTAAPPDVLTALTQLANISVYNVSLLTQRAALAALGAGEDSIVETVRAAQAAATELCDALRSVEGVRFRVPEGGAYVFADLGALLGGRGADQLLEACLDEGVVFAPGVGFGAAYESCARFCFTAMAPAHLRRGTTRLVQALERFRTAGRS